MRLGVHIVSLITIFLITSVAWMALGGIMSMRTSQQEGDLQGKVAELWGAPQAQVAPVAAFTWVDQELQTESRTEAGRTIEVQRLVAVPRTEVVALESSDVRASLNLDQRRKGLLWFPLYNVEFSADYRVVHRDPHAGTLAITFVFPDPGALYDDFHFTVDGVESAVLQPVDGMVTQQVSVVPGQEVGFSLHYRSRGMRQWSYEPTKSAAMVRNLQVALSTDFQTIDFPAYTLSPTDKTEQGSGWLLTWKFDQVVTGHGMGVIMPERVQPGPLAASMAWSAPIGLGLFTLMVFVVALLRRIPMHPMHHVFLAAAFFAFHLLFGYLADRLPVEAAFAVASVVSVFLVVTYLQRAVSARFAYGPVALAQLVYLVGFGLAHFWEGNTGLTVTVLGVLTLFALMQLTAKVDWSAEFGNKKG